MLLIVKGFKGERGYRAGIFLASIFIMNLLQLNEEEGWLDSLLLHLIQYTAFGVMSVRG